MDGWAAREGDRGSPNVTESYSMDLLGSQAPTSQEDGSVVALPSCLYIWPGQWCCEQISHMAVWRIGFSVVHAIVGDWFLAILHVTCEKRIILCS